MQLNLKDKDIISKNRDGNYLLALAVLPHSVSIHKSLHLAYTGLLPACGSFLRCTFFNDVKIHDTKPDNTTEPITSRVSCLQQDEISVGSFAERRKNTKRNDNSWQTGIDFAVSQFQILNESLMQPGLYSVDAFFFFKIPTRLAGISSIALKRAPCRLKEVLINFRKRKTQTSPSTDGQSTREGRRRSDITHYMGNHFRPKMARSMTGSITFQIKIN